MGELPLERELASIALDLRALVDRLDAALSRAGGRSGSQPLQGVAVHPLTKVGSDSPKTSRQVGSSPLDKRSRGPSRKGAEALACEQAAEHLCRLLEEHANKQADTPGRRRVTKTWLVAMERLMRLDERTERQIEYVIGWLGQDTFWGPNVLSAPTLRKQFDTLAARIRSQKRTTLPDQGASVGLKLAREAADRLGPDDGSNERSELTEADRRGLVSQLQFFETWRSRSGHAHSDEARWLADNADAIRELARGGS